LAAWCWEWESASLLRWDAGSAVRLGWWVVGWWAGGLVGRARKLVDGRNSRAEGPKLWKLWKGLQPADRDFNAETISPAKLNWPTPGGPLGDSWLKMAKALPPAGRNLQGELASPAGGLVGWWAGGLQPGGLVGWWAGGLVGWWAGGLQAVLSCCSRQPEATTACMSNSVVLVAS
jgi:hypothetical protein